jgi:hypothetical protein
MELQEESHEQAYHAIHDECKLYEEGLYQSILLIALFEIVERVELPPNCNNHIVSHSKEDEVGRD